MGKPGKKASNIFQNPGIKHNGKVTMPEIKGIGSPLKKKGCYGSPAKFNAGLKKAAADGKLDNNPKFKNAVQSSPAKMGHKSPAKKDPYKKFAKKATDTAIDVMAGPIGIIPGMKDKVQSLKNKKNKALGLGVTYKESYADADKKKYPSYDSFEKDAKSYNKKKSPAKKKVKPSQAGAKAMVAARKKNVSNKEVGTEKGRAKGKAIIAKVKKEGEAKVSASAKKFKSPAKKRVARKAVANARRKY